MAKQQSIWAGGVPMHYCIYSNIGICIGTPLAWAGFCANYTDYIELHNRPLNNSV